MYLNRFIFCNKLCSDICDLSLLLIVRVSGRAAKVTVREDGAVFLGNVWKKFIKYKNRSVKFPKLGKYFFRYRERLGIDGRSTVKMSTV